MLATESSIRNPLRAGGRQTGYGLCDNKEAHLTVEEMIGAYFSLQPNGKHSQLMQDVRRFSSTEPPSPRLD